LQQQRFQDVLGFLAPLNPTKAIETIRVPIKYKDLETDEEKFKLEDRPFLDPHSIIRFLFQEGKLKIPEHHVRRYWEHSANFGEEWAKTVDNHQMIPLGIFGDGATISTEFGSASVIGLFLSVVLWRPRSIRASRFLLFSISEAELWSHHTMSRVLRRLTWSLNALYNGRHPTVDPWGNELPERMRSLSGTQITSDSLRFATTEIRGDWSWHKKLWRFEKTSWNGIRMCHWCRAVASGEWSDLYWNLSNSSNFHNNHFSLEEFMEERMPSRGICHLPAVISIGMAGWLANFKFLSRENPIVKP